MSKKIVIVEVREKFGWGICDRRYLADCPAAILFVEWLLGQEKLKRISGGNGWLQFETSKYVYDITKEKVENYYDIEDLFSRGG